MSSSSTCSVTEEIGCDNKITDTDSLQERDEAQNKKKSSDIFDNVTSIKVTKLFISSEAYTRNSWFSNGGMRKGISVLKHQCLQLGPLCNCMPSSA